MDGSIGATPYVLKVGDDVLMDLKHRLENHRSWSSSSPMSHHKSEWAYGVPPAFMAKLL